MKTDVLIVGSGCSALYMALHLPEDLNNLPQIDLTNSKSRALKSSYDKVIEINNETIKKASENR